MEAKSKTPEEILNQLLNKGDGQYDYNYMLEAMQGFSDQETASLRSAYQDEQAKVLMLRKALGKIAAEFNDTDNSYSVSFEMMGRIAQTALAKLDELNK